MYQFTPPPLRYIMHKIEIYLRLYIYNYFNLIYWRRVQHKNEVIDILYPFFHENIKTFSAAIFVS